MFETTFTHQSALALPGNVSIEAGIDLLHDFDTVIRFSPDVRNTKSIPAPNGKGAKINGVIPVGQQWFEVEDDLPFIPKRLWSGGVKYNAIFVPTQDGCDITIMAPGGFTSVNHWKLIREHVPEEKADSLTRVKSKDLLHADNTGGGWYVQIVSDAKCNRTFVSFVKGFLKNSHEQLERAYIDKLQHLQAIYEDKVPAMVAQAELPLSSNVDNMRPANNRRPTLGRRRSTGF
ncbi:hypothetical protein K431DRAFT_280408 [Polychaeton citri CBS 116435]|uniref:DUF7053 domain-containing protein n=1 Tax=Polychaeton citri CBS 116435 TaxID=1314669 RepID=A0A9P4QFK3_9PEZI|nr:hypothetical protein K431DRAFT_280408 [Polychaeton citri CBS 116435]